MYCSYVQLYTYPYEYTYKSSYVYWNMDMALIRTPFVLVVCILVLVIRKFLYLYIFVHKIPLEDMKMCLPSNVSFHISDKYVHFVQGLDVMYERTYIHSILHSFCFRFSYCETPELWLILCQFGFDPLASGMLVCRSSLDIDFAYVFYSPNWMRIVFVGWKIKESISCLLFV